MAALVTGLIPILRTAVDSTTTYKCRSMWFGFLCIRLVILFVAELPWFKLDSDFKCNGTQNSICTAACFNQHFDKPIMVAWNFLYILLILSVLLMELFSSHLRYMAVKRSSQPEKSSVEMEAGAGAVAGAGAGAGAVAGAGAGAGAGIGSGSGPSHKAKIMIDLHKDRATLWFYMFSTIVRIVVELWFVYILLSWNLPMLDSGPFKCTTENCPVSLCMVRATAEKRMSIYALATMSGMVILTSTLFCLYCILHYLCKF